MNQELIYNIFFFFQSWNSKMQTDMKTLLSTNLSKCSDIRMLVTVYLHCMCVWLLTPLKQQSESLILVWIYDLSQFSLFPAYMIHFWLKEDQYKIKLYMHKSIQLYFIWFIKDHSRWIPSYFIQFTICMFQKIDSVSIQFQDVLICYFMFLV